MKIFAAALLVLSCFAATPSTAQPRPGHPSIILINPQTGPVTKSPLPRKPKPRPAPTFIQPPAEALAQCTDRFPKLPALATRLHVSPIETPTATTLRMCDGRSYDLIALINALLDRMEKIR